jgi:hypothetical protein
MKSIKPMPKYKVYLKYEQIITAKNKKEALMLFDERLDWAEENMGGDLIGNIIKIKEIK